MEDFQFPEASSIAPQVLHQRFLKSSERKVYSPAVVWNEARVMSIVSALYAAEREFVGYNATKQVDEPSSFGSVTRLQHLVLAGNLPIINSLRAKQSTSLHPLCIPKLPSSNLSSSPLSHWVSRFTLAPVPVNPLTVDLPCPHESHRARPPIPIRDGSAYYNDCSETLHRATLEAAQREQQLHHLAKQSAAEASTDATKSGEALSVRTDPGVFPYITTGKSGNQLSDVSLSPTTLQLPLFVRDGITIGDAPVDRLPLNQVLYAMSRGQGELDRTRALVKEGILPASALGNETLPENVEIPDRFASFESWSDESDPAWVDWDAIKRGQEAYMTHSGHIFMALSFVLILGFVERRLSDVLVLSGEGLDMTRTYARYLFTNRHVVEWMQSNLRDEHSDGRRSLRQVRCLHAHARYRARDYYAQEVAREALARVRAERAVLEALQAAPEVCGATGEESGKGGVFGVDVEEWQAARYSALLDELTAAVGEPLSQYDLALVQLAFSSFCLSLVTKFFGLNLTIQEQHDICHLWRYLGYRLGIHDEFNACSSFDRMTQCSDESYAFLIFSGNDKTARLRVRDVKDMLRGVCSRYAASTGEPQMKKTLEELETLLKNEDSSDSSEIASTTSSQPNPIPSSSSSASSSSSSSPLVFTRALPVVPGTATAIAKLTISTFSQHAGMGRRLFATLFGNCTLGQAVLDAGFTGIAKLTDLTHRTGVMRAVRRNALVDVAEPFTLAMVLADIAGEAFPVIRDTYLRLEANTALTTAAAEYAALTPLKRFGTPAETKHASLPLLLKLRAVPDALWRVWDACAQSGVLCSQEHKVGGKWTVSMASLALDCADDEHFHARAWVPRTNAAGRRVLQFQKSADKTNSAKHQETERLLFRSAVLISQALFSPSAGHKPTEAGLTPSPASATANDGQARCPFTGKVASAGSSCPFSRLKGSSKSVAHDATSGSEPSVSTSAASLPAGSAPPTLSTNPQKVIAVDSTLTTFADSSHSHLAYSAKSSVSGDTVKSETSKPQKSQPSLASSVQGCPVMGPLSDADEANQTPASSQPDPKAAAHAALYEQVLAAHTLEPSALADNDEDAPRVSTLPSMLATRLQRAYVHSLRKSGVSADSAAFKTLVPPVSKAEQSIWTSGLRDHMHMRPLLAAESRYRSLTSTVKEITQHTPDRPLDDAETREHADSDAPTTPTATATTASDTSALTTAKSAYSKLLSALILPAPPRPHPAATIVPSIHSVLLEHVAVLPVPAPRKCPMFSSARAVRIAAAKTMGLWRDRQVPFVCVWPENMPLPGVDADLPPGVEKLPGRSMKSPENCHYQVLKCPSHERALELAPNIGIGLGRTILQTVDVRMKHVMNNHLGSRVKTTAITHMHLARLQRNRQRAMEVYDKFWSTVECFLSYMNPVLLTAAHMNGYWRKWVVRLMRWCGSYTAPETALLAALTQSYDDIVKDGSSHARMGSKDCDLEAQVPCSGSEYKSDHGALSDVCALLRGAIAIDNQILEDNVAHLTSTATGWQSTHHRSAFQTSDTNSATSLKDTPSNHPQKHSQLTPLSVMLLRYAARHCATPIDAALMLATDRSLLRPALHAGARSHNADVVAAAFAAWIRIGCGYGVDGGEASCTPCHLASVAKDSAVVEYKDDKAQCLALSLPPSAMKVAISRDVLQEIVSKGYIPGSQAASCASSQYGSDLVSDAFPDILSCHPPAKTFSGVMEAVRTLIADTAARLSSRTEFGFFSVVRTLAWPTNDCLAGHMRAITTSGSVPPCIARLLVSLLDLHQRACNTIAPVIAETTSDDSLEIAPVCSESLACTQATKKASSGSRWMPWQWPCFRKLKWETCLRVDSQIPYDIDDYMRVLSTITASPHFNSGSDRKGTVPATSVTNNTDCFSSCCKSYTFAEDVSSGSHKHCIQIADGDRLQTPRIVAPVALPLNLTRAPLAAFAHAYRVENSNFRDNIYSFLIARDLCLANPDEQTLQTLKMNFPTISENIPQFHALTGKDWALDLQCALSETTKALRSDETLRSVFDAVQVDGDISAMELMHTSVLPVFATQRIIEELDVRGIDANEWIALADLPLM